MFHGRDALSIALSCERLRLSRPGCIHFTPPTASVRTGSSANYFGFDKYIQITMLGSEPVEQLSTYFVDDVIHQAVRVVS